MRFECEWPFLQPVLVGKHFQPLIDYWRTGHSNELLKDGQFKGAVTYTVPALSHHARGNVYNL